MNRLFLFLFVFTVLVGCDTTKRTLPSESSSKKLAKSATTPIRNVTSKQSLSLFHSALHNYTILNYEKALQEAKKYTVTEPEDDAGYFLLSKIQYQLKDSVESMSALEKAMQKDPNNVYYHIELANGYLASRNYLKAETEYRQLIEMVPNSSEYQFGLYRSYIGLKKYDKALDALEIIEKINHSNPEILTQKYLLFIQKKDFGKAEKTLLDGLHEFPGDSQILFALYDFYTQKREADKFLPILEKEIAHASNNSDLHFLLADFYLHKKQEDKAMAILIPLFSNPDVDEQTKHYFFMDNVIKAKNLSSASAKKLAEATVQENQDAFFNIFLGSVYDDEKNTEKALYYYKKGIEHAENKKETYLRIAYLEYESEMYDSLNLDAKKALELFPMEASLYYFYSMGLLRTHQFEKAIETIQQGSMYVTDEMDRADFNSILAESYFGLKEYEKGSQLYEKAIAETKENTYLKVNYALVLVKNRMNLDKASLLIEEVLGKQANNAHALYVKEKLFFEKGEYQKAKTILDYLISTNPDDPGVLNDLGDVYYKLGNVEDAVEFWKRAMKANYEDQELLNRKITDKKLYEK